MSAHPLSGRDDPGIFRYLNSIFARRESRGFLTMFWRKVFEFADYVAIGSYKSLFAPRGRMHNKSNLPQI